MNEATTPILKGLRSKGPTFYTFSSATNDTTLLFSNNNIEMNFSKFACIKLPRWKNELTQSLYVDVDEILSTGVFSAGDDENIWFVKSYIQNYIENFISHVDVNRTDDDFANFAESAFWKALQSVNDIEQDGSRSTIKFDSGTDYLAQDSTIRKKFKELENDVDYEQIVKYIGDINVLNHVKNLGKEYLEIFAHIPTSAGVMEDILFKPNENLDTNLATFPVENGVRYVAGHEDAFDSPQTENDKYLGAVYDDKTNNKYVVSSDKDFLQIDWNDIESDQSQQDKYNKGDFDFNAVLVYYDIKEEGDESSIRRNLYGILLLDDFNEVGDIPTFTKYQPSADNAGNSFGFRFNLTFSNNTNQVTSQVSVNDYSTVSMELYMDALERLKIIADKYGEFEKIINNQQAKINSLNSQLLGISSNKINKTQYDALVQMVQTLSDQVNQS